MAFEDLTQRFPAMNNTFSKTESQQKMTYAQMANSQEEQLRFFMEHSLKAWFIANSKPGQPTALLPRPSAPPSSATSIALKKAQAQETQCINFEFEQIESRQITSKRQASQATLPPLTSPQGWRISERNGQNSWSPQSFLVRPEQDGTERLLEEVSRIQQMEI
ncbi:MAG: hypothetical protein EZS28_036886 [Streblomastix strix]|uniref:Uncharacterized protein n=1 Tax=Streblomastix strix TaxID=222440 RepID=A0A5J4UAW1_9EUKA|nr:MAG: hypothetical protein EZS28_036886 [Streblomastix strix]